jgi:hypothetical protein
MTTVARTDRAAINFYELTDRLGIESGWAVAPRFALVHACAIRKCRECDDPEACRAWLKAATGAPMTPPKGCPNADLFVELLYDRPAISRKDSD